MFKNKMRYFNLFNMNFSDESRHHMQTKLRKNWLKNPIRVTEQPANVTQ